MTDPNLNTHTHLDVRQTGAKLRPVEEPAPTMLGEGLAKGVPVWRNGNQANAAEREMTEPAPTIHFGHNLNEVTWSLKDNRSEDFQRGPVNADQPAPTLGTNARLSEWVTGQQRVAGDSEQRDPRALDEPSYTLRANAGGGSDGVGRSGGVQWVTERPATVVQGDSRIAQPGHTGNGTKTTQMAGAVRVSVQEAAILQSFPADFPWQGSRTAQFRQIGNAVPPGLAKAILGALLGVAPPEPPVGASGQHTPRGRSDT